MAFEPRQWEIALTEGALNNGYLRLPKDFDLSNDDRPTSGGHIRLELDDLGPVETAIDAKRHMFRWRGWKTFYRAHKLVPGDVIVMTRKAKTRYHFAPRARVQIPSPEVSKSIAGFVNKVICGDAAKTMCEIPSGSVDLIVISPPCWNLVDYHVDGQIGQSCYATNLKAVVLFFRLIGKR